MPLPEHYPSPSHLPFNRTALAGEFVLETPERDPGGPGVWVLLRGSELIVTASDEPGLPAGDLPFFTAIESEPVYLGRYRGHPCRALAIGRETELPAGLAAKNLLATNPDLSLALLSLGGMAGQILHWLSGSRCCDRCGLPTMALAGGWGRRCSLCNYDHFPHIHPCVIVLVRRGREVLLTRKAEWPAGRYSLVAGFLDFGECLEEAVVREVQEETGVKVGNVRYVGSQSWPFPSQLMAGFTADFESGEVVIEESELEDVRWFRTDNLPALPPRRSIARYILDKYLEEGRETRDEGRGTRGKR
jgi:NAD+ diphosphatase